MNSKEVFERTGKLGFQIEELQKKLEQINLNCLELMKICQHEIVFKYNDNYPRKVYADGSYFCPARGKTIKCFCKSQLEETVFDNSRIIPLTNLSLFGTSDVYYTIRNEVYNNYDLYYNHDIPVSELSKKMEEILEEKQNKYEKPELVLKKCLKKNK